MEKMPFFVLGNPRSGTSLFRLMLNAHPQMAVPPECGFAEWLYKDYNNLSVSQDLYSGFCQAVLNSKKFETWGLAFDDLMSELTIGKPYDYKGLVYAVYKAYAKKTGKPSPLVGDKNNYYIKLVSRLDDIFPDCKKVFIVRDGRDVACSYIELHSKKIDSKYKPVLPHDIVSIAEEWVDNAKTVLNYQSKGALCVRYEDLVLHPEETLTKVCDYLGVAYNSQMLNYYAKNDEPEDFMSWKGRTREPVGASAIRRYARDLSQQQIHSFEKASEQYLSKFGYLPS